MTDILLNGVIKTIDGIVYGFTLAVGFYWANMMFRWLESKASGKLPPNKVKGGFFYTEEVWKK